MENIKNEIWKDIPNYEGKYQVSSFGRVKSFTGHNGVKERILKTFLNNKYIRSYLFKDNKLKTISVHVLVAMAFLGHKPDGTHKVCVDHINNDKLDNRLENLQLITNRENCSKDKGKITGASYDKMNKKWQSKISYFKRKISLGWFNTQIEAGEAYKKALLEIKNGEDLNLIYPKKRSYKIKKK